MPGDQVLWSLGSGSGKNVCHLWQDQAGVWCGEPAE